MKEAVKESGRNDPCPCGSGRKFKQCCLRSGGGPGAGSSPATAREKPAPAPKSAGALLREAMELHQAGRTAKASLLYREVLAQRPRERDALLGLARIMYEAGSHLEALDFMERATRAGAREGVHWAFLAALYDQVARWDDLAAAARKAVAAAPSLATGHAFLGLALERLNRLDEATASLERALQLDPGVEVASVALARVRRRRGDFAGAKEILEACVGRGSAIPGALSPAYHALGEVLDQMGEYDRAYEAFALGGAEDGRLPEAQRLDPQQVSRNIRAWATGLAPEIVRRWDGHDFGDRGAPAFLVGFPRSGTTMTEMVLGAHPSIATSEEKPLLASVMQRLDAMALEGEPVVRVLARLTAVQVAELRSEYWAAAESILGDSLHGKLLVDKNPLEIIALGLINVIFPEARVIVALRDPRDCCLSCFMQQFQINAGMINFLSLDRTTAFYAEVMDLWLKVRAMTSLRFVEVRYEDTVSDLEGQARRILDVLDLPWTDEVLAFQQRAKERSISTPSYEAVTQKVTTKAIARWKKYEKHLAPYLDRLAPFVREFGYE